MTLTMTFQLKLLKSSNNCRANGGELISYCFSSWYSSHHVTCPSWWIS